MQDKYHQGLKEVFEEHSNPGIYRIPEDSNNDAVVPASSMNSSGNSANVNLDTYWERPTTQSGETDTWSDKGPN